MPRCDPQLDPGVHRLDASVVTVFGIIGIVVALASVMLASLALAHSIRHGLISWLRGK